MKIALDFDDTYTADKALWLSFIRMARTLGHEVRFVTSRRSSDDNNDILEEAMKSHIRILYCNGRAKRECWDADIWIDDNPTALVQNFHWYKKEQNEA